jgi:hypothetical protein
MKRKFEPDGEPAGSSLQNSQFTEFNERVREEAFVALRTEIRKRRIATGMGVISLAAVVQILSWIIERRSPMETMTPPIAITAIEPVPVPALEPVVAGVITPISDEELLAIFPPGSCFYAEVDGQKILVFTDPEVRKRFYF